MHNTALQGLIVHYTRDARHWQAFAQAITGAGGTAVHTPTLSTRPLALSANAKHNLDSAQALIFTSVNAVDALHSQYQPHSEQQLVSIGAKTTAALQIHHQRPIITAPKPYDSEALLSIYQPRAQRIAIIAAQGGRQLLANQLRQHNQVHFCYCYERYCLPFTTSAYQAHLPHAITMASCTTLDCFIENCPQDILKLIQCRTTVVAISIKVADYARMLGFQHTVHTDTATEQAMINLIYFWWTQQKESSNE